MKFKNIALVVSLLLFIVILNLPTPEGLTDPAWKLVAATFLMLSWWISEAAPIAITALLPIVLFPLLEISELKTATAPYANPIIFLFMGGFMIAIALEKWNLHKRIALGILAKTGTNANGIILGFMLATAFLSMWISNTATTVMMLPIANSVIKLLNSSEESKKSSGFSVALMLGIAYAANIGGTATIIGTPPNSVLVGFLKNNLDIDFTFADWFVIGFPFAASMLILTYIVMTKVLFKNEVQHFSKAQDIFEIEKSKLGKLSVNEKRVLIIFTLTAFTWIFGAPISKFIGIKLDDVVIALLATFFLFLLPAKKSDSKFILNWEDTEKLPWGVLLLFGGGLSLADSMSSTGLIEVITNQIIPSEGQISSFALVILLTSASLFLTEVMSNVALVTLFLPIVSEIAIKSGGNVLEVCIPVTLAASCAFMLPMSTPPNALVFSSGYIKIPEMAKAGFILNCLAIIIITLLCQLLI